jgi:hypothetical protein
MMMDQQIKKLRLSMGIVRHTGHVLYANTQTYAATSSFHESCLQFQSQ